MNWSRFVFLKRKILLEGSQIEYLGVVQNGVTTEAKILMDNARYEVFTAVKISSSPGP
jgi:hypothetical protein